MASASSSGDASRRHDRRAHARNGGRRSGLVIFTVLASVATLPLVGLFFFRLYDNQLIHQTQAELIAQSRVLAAVYAREVRSPPRRRHRARRGNAARKRALIGKTS